MSGLIQPIVGPALAPPKAMISRIVDVAGWAVQAQGTPNGRAFSSLYQPTPWAWTLTADITGPGVVTMLSVSRHMTNDVAFKVKIVLDDVDVLVSQNSINTTAVGAGIVVINVGEPVPFAKSFKVYLAAGVAASAGELKAHVAYRLS